MTCKYTGDTDTVEVTLSYSTVPVSRKLLAVRGFECVQCDRAFLNRETSSYSYKPNPDRKVCSYCVRDEDIPVRYCGRCNSAFPSASYNDVCPDCLELSVSQAYRWMPDLVYTYNADILREYGIDVYGFGSKPYIGIELELEFNCTTRTEFRKFVEQIYALEDGRVMLKHDGTIECGVELVTIPDDYKNHLAYFEKFYELYPTFGGIVGNQTGIHVHLNKSALTKLHLGKLNKFINDRQNFDFMLAISDRYNGEYAEYASVDWRHATSNTQKYRALNIKDFTVEYRMFKAAKRYSHFAARIEFVMASFYFTKDASAKELTHNAFTDWVTMDGRFPNLVQYMHSREII